MIRFIAICSFYKSVYNWFNFDHDIFANRLTIYKEIPYAQYTCSRKIILHTEK